MKDFTIDLTNGWTVISGDPAKPWACIRYRPIYTGLSNTEPAELLSVDAARKFCGGMAKSTWYDYKSRGLIPAPVCVGGRVLWRRSDLKAWIEDGRPGRAVFEERKETRRKRKAPSRTPGGNQT